MGLKWNNVLRSFGISEFWTISDWTELGLVELNFRSLLSAVMRFARVFILLHDTSMGSMCTETTVICFAVLWRVVISLAVGFGLSCKLPQVRYIFVFV